MRICRFDLASDTSPRRGLVCVGEVRAVTAALDVLPVLRWPLPAGDAMIANLELLKPRIAGLAGTAQRYALTDVMLRAPVANPGKFLCGAGNWPEHQQGDPTKNMRRMGWLLKTTNALAGQDDGVVLAEGHPTLHEAELAVIIGRGGRHIAAADALDHVAGYTIGLDMTAQWGTNFSHNKCAMTASGYWARGW